MISFRKGCFVFLLPAMILVGPAFAQPEFSPVSHYPFEAGGPFGLLVEDLDGDGNLDLVTGHFEGDYVTWNRGVGDGTFLDGEIVFAFDPPVGNVDGLASGDFNRDGAVDLAVTRRTAGDLTILIGDGQGGFSLLRRLQMPGGLSRLVASDLNGDQLVDLAVAGIDEKSLRVFLGDGRGTFQSLTPVLTGMTPFSLAVLDADRDGTRDLAVANFNEGGFSVHFGDGTGHFGPGNPYATGQNPTFIVSADWNSDGNPDLATAVRGNESVIINGNTGAGDFSRSLRVAAGTSPQVIAVADFDHDGALDLATVGSLTILVFRGVGNGTFEEPIVLPMEASPIHVASGDFNGDCLPDLATVGFRSSMVSVRLNETPFDGDERLRLGNVNRIDGGASNVLFLNGSAGEGPERIVEYDVLSPFRLEMRRPPRVQPPATAPYAVYLWLGDPDDTTRQVLPFGIGCMIQPVPLTGGEPQPDLIWNNAGRRSILGEPSRASSPAPDTFVDLPQLRRVARFYIQGLIFDPGSTAAVPASITNGISARPVVNR